MLNMPPVNYDVVVCDQGLDQVTPSLSMKSSAVKDCLNFEVSPSGGLSRIGGYERFSGKLKPSDATYTLVQVTSFTNTPTAGQTLTGFTSAVTGVVAYVGANFLVLTKTTGTYTIGETVKVGATVIGVLETVTVTTTHKQTAQYFNYAADQYRSDIAAVPGSGSVRGVAFFNDVLYAFKNNAGGTAVDLYKSSTGGWVQVAFEYEVAFSNANTSVGAGDVLTQGGVTATIRRVLVQTGTLVSGTNTGRLVISVTAGGNFAAGAATSTGAGALTLSGAQTAITMSVGGKFEFVQANFFGQASGLRLYGCDGVNRMFEFDGTYFVPIATGVTPDTPKHLCAHKNHLMASVQSSAFNSGVGDPYNWTSTAGGAEQPCGDTVTGFLVQSGSQTSGTLAIFCRNTTFMLYGTGSSTWNLVPYNNGVGALDYTLQQMAQSYFLDDLGLSALQTAQVYGNFEHATLTNNIKPFITSKRASVAYSSLSRERSQYRLFFSDGIAMYSTIVNGKYLGSMQIRFGHTVYCACTGELSTGEEVLFFGSTDGYVYQLDRGSSFDGAVIDAYVTFNWNHAGSPRINKRWRALSAEINGDSYAEFQFGYSLSYGSSDAAQPGTATYTSNLSAGLNWDDATIVWDTPGLTWDGKSLSPSEIEMEGTSENVQVTITSGTDYIYSYKLNSLIFHYTPRRGIRG